MKDVSKDSCQLAALLRERKDELMASWRRTVRLMEVAKDLEVAEINDHVGGLLDEMALELEREGEDSVIEAGGPEPMRQIPVIHGKERLSLGFDVEEIVYEYNALRSAILKLADTHQVNLVGSPGLTVHRVLDSAVGTAVKTFAAQQAEINRQRRNEHLAFIVHDLRSPLSAISLAASVLRRQAASEMDSEERKLFEIIDANARRLERHTQRILLEDASMRDDTEQNLVCSWVNLYDLIQALVTELKPLADRSQVRLETKIDELLTGFVDETRVTLIFQNLLSNAIRCAEGGLVTISMARASAGVDCCVEDTGIGIEESRLESIFQVGESDDPEGFGLGLPIVKRLVTAHRGSIRVESQLGKGSHFFFDFPDPDVSALSPEDT